MTTEKKPDTPENPPAFPVEVYYNPNGTVDRGIQTGNASGWHTGMTLRDYFAAKAMQGVIVKNGDILSYETVAKFSYEMADAMLKERSNQ